jgi:hypothetical protein
MILLILIIVIINLSPSLLLFLSIGSWSIDWLHSLRRMLYNHQCCLLFGISHFPALHFGCKYCIMITGRTKRKIAKPSPVFLGSLSKILAISFFARISSTTSAVVMSSQQSLAFFSYSKCWLFFLCWCIWLEYNSAMFLLALFIPGNLITIVLVLVQYFNGIWQIERKFCEFQRFQWIYFLFILIDFNLNY